MSPRFTPPKPPNAIGQRLKFEMKSRGVTSADLADRAGVKTSFLYDVISGKSANPSTMKLAQVAAALGIALADLLPQQPAAPPHTDDYIALPYLDAGQSQPGAKPSPPVCFAGAWLKRFGDIASLRLFTVRGDPMEPTLSHNDTVLVDTALKNPAQPGIYVLSDGFALSVKRIERASSGRVRIVCDNPHYASYETSPADAGIIGRVVWFSRSI